MDVPGRRLRGSSKKPGALRAVSGEPSGGLRGTLEVS